MFPAYDKRRYTRAIWFGNGTTMRFCVPFLCRRRCRSTHLGTKLCFAQRSLSRHGAEGGGRSRWWKAKGEPCKTNINQPWGENREFHIVEIIWIHVLENQYQKDYVKIIIIHIKLCVFFGIWEISKRLWFVRRRGLIFTSCTDVLMWTPGDQGFYAEGSFGNLNIPTYRCIE